MIEKLLLRDTIIYGSADFVTKFISFLAFPIMTMKLSTTQFGILELIFTCIALVGLLVNCGINNAVQRYYWDDKTSFNDQQKIITSGLAVILLIGCMLLFLTLTLVHAFELEEVFLIPEYLVLVIVVFIVANQLAQYILDVTRLHLKPLAYLYIACATRVFAISAGLYAIIILNLGIEGYVVAQAIVLLVTVPVSIVFVRKDISLMAISMSWGLELMKFGYPFIAVGLAYWIFTSMDKWMLARMVSLNEVGIYSIAVRCSAVAMFAVMAFGLAWSPLAMKIKRDNPANYQWIYGSVLLHIIIAMIIICGSIAIFSGEILAIFFPQDYWQSALPLMLLVAAILFKSTEQVTAVGISITKKTYLFALLSWLAAVLNFTGNLILIPKYESLGAATTTLISNIFLTVGYFYYTQKLVPLRLNYKVLALLLFLTLVVFFFAFNGLSFTLTPTTLIHKLLFILLLLIVSFIIANFVKIER